MYAAYHSQIGHTMWQHTKLLPVYMCSLALAIEQAGLPWPGWPPYSNPAGESPWGSSPRVNGGHTRPKGPGHPVAGQGVNCLPLGPSGHWSSPGGKDCLYSLAVLCTQCTAELLPRSSGVHYVQRFGCTWYKLYKHTG